MTHPPDDAPTSGSGVIESIRIAAARLGLLAISALLAVGLVLWAFERLSASTQAIQAATLVLVALPMTGVVALCLEELRRRDWAFAAAALLVIGMLGWSLFRLSVG
jgi:hypothetical protein